MRFRTSYLIAGIAWALLLGPTAATALFEFAAGVSWLWLFGDDPWPAATQWVLPLIGLAGGILSAALCIILAVGYGRQRERQRQANLYRMSELSPHYPYGLPFLAMVRRDNLFDAIC